MLCGSEHYAYLGPAGTQPVWLLELYRRNGAWRVRAVGEHVGSFAHLHPALPAMIKQASTRAQVEPSEKSAIAPSAAEAEPYRAAPPNSAPPSPAPGSPPPPTAASIIVQAFRQLRGLIPAPENQEQEHAPQELPQVTVLKRALTENLERAKQGGDPMWLYDAQAALDDYLPTTLALHTRRHGHTLTPELETALADILRIATARQPQGDDAWEIQQRFLRTRAEEGRSTSGDNPLKLS